ncbi:MAG: ATP-binding protein, partial [Gemmatimonadaceae bacterium]|nr:ATP-binding protein [Gemmatimonadaceae bacterium]
MMPVEFSILGECVIRAGDHAVTPASPQLFGLLLLLGIEHERPWTRRELQEYLFTEPASEDAAHRLRQLLYRLRGLGIPLDGSRRAVVALAKGTFACPVELLERLPLPERASLRTARFEVLPGHRPKLSRVMEDWVEGVRDRIDARVRSVLLNDLRKCREQRDWRMQVQVAEVLHERDPSNAEVLEALAEGLALTGKADAALDALDRFIQSGEGLEDSVATARKMRGRIAKSRVTQRATTFRGREAALAFLEAEWRRVHDEGTRLGIVIGPPGMGKTRLAQEFAASIRLKGARVIQHACTAHSATSAQDLFRCILPALREMRGSLGAAPEYCATLDLLVPQLPGVRLVDSTTNARTLKDELQDALIDLLGAVTTDAPLLLVVDDSHLLDASSTATLLRLAASRDAARVHILCMSRPREAWVSAPSATRDVAIHVLAPLSEREACALLDDVRSRASSPEEVSPSDIVVRAGGNPFFLQALAAHAWGRLHSGESFSVSELADSTYFSLTDDERCVLECCLLLGAQATIARVRDLAALESDGLLRALRSLEERDL